jgi:Flp pilus assembly protein TadG
LSYPQGRHRSEKAQSLVEFALVLPVFLVLVLAIVEFGWLLRDYAILTNASREAARLGITKCASTSDQIAIQQRAVDRSSNLLTLSGVTPPTCPSSTGTDLRVTVSYTYRYITPLGPMLSIFSGGVWPSTLQISSTTSMRME